MSRQFLYVIMHVLRLMMNNSRACTCHITTIQLIRQLNLLFYVVVRQGTTACDVGTSRYVNELRAEASY